MTVFSLRESHGWNAHRYADRHANPRDPLHGHHCCVSFWRSPGVGRTNRTARAKSSSPTRTSAKTLLARATSREREITIRAAIGASRGRIVRQLLVEGTVLACGGLAAGCLMAYGGITALAGYLPHQGVPWETQIRLDQPVLLFALAAAAVATIGFGLFPALQSARREIADAGLVDAAGALKMNRTTQEAGVQA